MTNFNNNPILLADATMIIVSILDSRFSIRRYLSAHASTCDSIFWFTEATVGFGMCPPYIKLLLCMEFYRNRLRYRHLYD